MWPLQQTPAPLVMAALASFLTLLLLSATVGLLPHAPAVRMGGLSASSAPRCCVAAAHPPPPPAPTSSAARALLVAEFEEAALHLDGSALLLLVERFAAEGDDDIEVEAWRACAVAARQAGRWQALAALSRAAATVAQDSRSEKQPQQPHARKRPPQTPQPPPAAASSSIDDAPPVLSLFLEAIGACADVKEWREACALLEEVEQLGEPWAAGISAQHYAEAIRACRHATDAQPEGV